MSSLAQSVKNGPRAAKAKADHMDSQIRTAEAKAKVASDRAKDARRRAKKGGGPLAKLRATQADILDGSAASHRKRANQLKVAKAKLAERETRKAVQEAKPGRTVASTAAAGLVPIQPGQTRPAQPTNLARPGQDTPIRTPSQKGTPMPATSGEAVNVEQTRALLANLRDNVSDLRGSFEGASGSLASGGLAKLAGTLSSADDSLDSVMSSIDEADRYLSDQEAIAEAAQAAGEMHADTAFYG